MEVAAAQVLHGGVHSSHSSDGLFSPPQDIFTLSQTILFPPFLAQHLVVGERKYRGDFFFFNNASNNHSGNQEAPLH